LYADGDDPEGKNNIGEKKTVLTRLKRNQVVSRIPTEGLITKIYIVTGLKYMGVSIKVDG
jgi:hypothetical protein